MTGMNGAESLVRTMLASDVDVCFTNPGTSEMHFVAALDHVPGMRSVLALFEGVATGAADGYWRMARKPASTLLHLGPGLANGLSNLHNAKKAGSGILNIVGEHALPHLELDAPLASDIEGIARPVSHWVETSTSATDVGADAARAIQAASTAPGQVATLILPGDTAWTDGGVVADPLAAPTPQAVDAAMMDAAAAALDGSESLLLLGSSALTDDNLMRAARVAAKTGCGLLCEWSNARMERGAGRVGIDKVPYPIDQALEKLGGYKRIVLVGAREPIGFFAYPGKPARLTRPDVSFVHLAGPDADLDAALDGLEHATGAASTAPVGIYDRSEAPDPTGPLNPDSIAAALTASLPENAIVVDESVTTGRSFFPTTFRAAPITWLNNCGGSIGYGMPCAIGAAVACPDRKVAALIGDGSAMYTVQALWTMAREQLDITTVIFANHSYRILRGELTNVGVQNPGPRAVDMLSLDRPRLGWTEMARSMGVAATRVETAEDLTRAMRAGFEENGPSLIEVAL